MDLCPGRSAAPVISISITVEAYAAIKATLPVGADSFPPQPDGRGNVRLWLDRQFVDRLAQMRGPGESYSEVILALAGRKKPRATATRGSQVDHHGPRASWGSRWRRKGSLRAKTVSNANGGATINPDAPGVRSRSQRRLVDDPQDPIRVWIDKDAVTIDEGGAHSTWLRHNGRIARHRLAGRGGTREARAFLRRYGARPVWPRSLQGAGLRRRGRFKIRPNLAPDRSLVLGEAGRWDCQYGSNKCDRQSTHREAPVMPGDDGEREIGADSSD